MYARVVGGLQHDACLSGVHFVDAQRSVVDGVALLAHAVDHEKCLVWLLGVQPVTVNIIIYLHSVHLVRWRVALDCPEIVRLMNKCIGQGTVRHRVLVRLLEVRHHVC